MFIFLLIIVLLYWRFAIDTMYVYDHMYLLIMEFRTPRLPHEFFQWDPVLKKKKKTKDTHVFHTYIDTYIIYYT